MGAKDGALVVTGGASGLGSAIVEHFCKKGRDVALTYHKRPPGFPYRDGEVVGLHGGRVLAMPVDVRERAGLRTLMAQAVSAFGGLSHLITCAGVNRDKPFLDLTDEDWDEVVAVHLNGTFLACQEFVRSCGEGEAAIITLGAACGLQGRMHGANFCSAKGGISALTKCMARELAPRIRVNCLIPSAVDTEEVRHRYALDTELGRANLLANLPMGRLGRVSDVTHMVDAILSATYTTGEMFFVNGGEYMH